MIHGGIGYGLGDFGICLGEVTYWILVDAGSILVAVSACFIYAGISILLSTVSFFTVAQSDVENFTMQIKEVAKYPMTIYPKALQVVFTFISRLHL